MSLCCEATGSPRPRIEWLRAQQSSDSTPAFQEKRCLEVNTAKEKRDGDYICRATNPFGIAESVTAVVVPDLIGCLFRNIYCFVRVASLICFLTSMCQNDWSTLNKDLNFWIKHY